MPDKLRGKNVSRDAEHLARRTNSSMRHSSWENLKVYGVDKIFGGEGAPGHDVYMDKLKDERWHAYTDLVKRKRVHCQECGSTSHLQVHHIRYLPGLEPWEHPLSEVRLLCVDCHQTEHGVEATKVVIKPQKTLESSPAGREFSSAGLRGVPLEAESLREQLGEWITINAVVDEIRSSANGNTYINFGGRFPKAILTVVIFPSSASEFGALSKIVGKRVRVSGRVQDYCGALQIVANSERQIKLIN